MNCTISEQIVNLETELEAIKRIQAKYPNSYQHKVGKFIGWVSPDVGHADVTDFILVTDGETCIYLWGYCTVGGSQNAKVFVQYPVPLSFVVADMKADLLEGVKKHLGKGKT